MKKDDNKFTLNAIEKKWVDNNKSVLQDISVYTNVPIFSYNSEGIIFDYLDSLEKDTGLDFNKVSYTIGNEVKTDYAFMVKTEYDANDILMYQDNYVLVTASNTVYTNPTEIKGITIGVLNNTLDTVNNYLLGSDVTYKTFNDYNSIITSIGNDVDAAVVPKVEYLADVLEKENLSLSYNIDEYKLYYVLHLGSNNTLNSILTKYYKKWNNESYEKSFNNYLMTNYFSSTDDSSKSIAKLRSKRYTYGFTVNAPYDLLIDGDLKGINNNIISEFAKVSGITIEYKEFNSVSDMINSFNTNSIDFFFNENKKFNYNLDAYDTVSPYAEKMVILVNNKEDLIVNSVYSLSDIQVGVLKDSKIADYLLRYNIKVKEYDSMKKLISDNKIEVKAIDNYNYDYYINKGIKNYHKGYEVALGDDYNYTFRDISDNKDFMNFFNFYLTFISSKALITEGITDSLNINVLLVTLRYAIIVLGILITITLISFGVYKFKHRKKAKNNLSKEEKLKYIDMLTSLKNRNYLNDNIELWDESEVYPQAIIIVDLNNIAYINDNYGHAEGDTIIKEAANVLIKNQNPNSEIIRTNGNEFLIYLVSYDEKQIVSYIKKLNKEFKDLTHGFGAAIGYSIINDGIKTIDDAINEATIDMKNNKEELSKD